MEKYGCRGVRLQDFYAAYRSASLGDPAISLNNWASEKKMVAEKGSIT